MTLPSIDLARIRVIDRPVAVAHVVDSDEGYWSVQARPPGQAPIDLTEFRGLPTQLGAMAFTDPFGPSTMSIKLPAVTVFDGLGYGELAWCVAGTNVDIVYHGPLPPNYPGKGFAFEGYIGSFNWEKDGLGLQLPGAMHQLDNYLAKPGYPPQPLPYEYAITRIQQDHPDVRLKGCVVEWPSWWSTRYTPPAKGTASYLVPTGVKSGDHWTAMLTRSTGSWNPVLTGYIQSLLTIMYTARGRFTLDLDPGRVPVLRHRDILTALAEDDLVVIDPAAPGIDVTLSEDWTQSTNVIYGQGTSLSGVVYDGMNVSPDGSSTSYDPLAYARQVHPASDGNGWFDKTRMRREISMQVQQGLDENQAQLVAAAHLARFGDPGVTGTITLKTDPLFNGAVMSRALIRAGMSVRLRRVFGNPEGITALVTASSYDFAQETQSLTIDTRYRDQLTVDEVRLRSRDALNVPRMLVAGGYSPPVSDMLLPWNYAGGSGFIPSSKEISSLRLFQGMPADARFPWTEWTAKRPPKDPAWANCYVHLKPASANADNNWATKNDKAGVPIVSRIAIPIKFAQAATIRLLQLAAYDSNGNVLPVDFHVSFYTISGANPSSTPMLPSKYSTKYPPYKAGQHYPFFPDAWEAYRQDGTKTDDPRQNGAVQSAGLIRAYGSNYEKAGHWPGSSASGTPATGLLVDESQWSVDLSTIGAFDPYSTTDNLTNPQLGYIYMLIYCDAQKAQDVYFLGRLFRVEPGTGTS